VPELHVGIIKGWSEDIRLAWGKYLKIKKTSRKFITLRDVVFFFPLVGVLGARLQGFFDPGRAPGSQNDRGRLGRFQVVFPLVGKYSRKKAPRILRT
jgi:hypothetical protein